MYSIKILDRETAISEIINRLDKATDEELTYALSGLMKNTATEDYIVKNKSCILCLSNNCQGGCFCG